HGRLREECLAVSWFQNLFDARRKIAAWQIEYNQERPHSSLGYRTPKEFAAAHAADFYTAERGARDSNAVPCPSRSLSYSYVNESRGQVNLGCDRLQYTLACKKKCARDSEWPNPIAIRIQNDVANTCSQDDVNLGVVPFLGRSQKMAQRSLHHAYIGVRR